MNENINLTKILKNCPKGTKLYSLVSGEVYFSHIDKKVPDLIVVSLENGFDECYSSDGRFNYYFNGECVLFPSKEQRDWSKFTAPWYKKEKFDPKTLKPFDKVLVRDCEYHKWTCDLFSNMVDTLCKFQCFGFTYNYCIPYNNDTKHLVGTTEEAPEYYRYWED